MGAKTSPVPLCTFVRACAGGDLKQDKKWKRAARTELGKQYLAGGGGGADRRRCLPWCMVPIGCLGLGYCCAVNFLVGYDGWRPVLTYSFCSHDSGLFFRAASFCWFQSDQPFHRSSWGDPQFIHAWYLSLFRSVASVPLPFPPAAATSSTFLLTSFIVPVWSFQPAHPLFSTGSETLSSTVSGSVSAPPAAVPFPPFLGEGAPTALKTVNSQTAG